MNMEPRKQASADGANAARKAAILDALARFMNQRSGIEFGNYGDVKAFRAEQRSIYTDLKHARVLLAAVKYADGIDADALLKAAVGAFSGRLTITPKFEPCAERHSHAKPAEGCARCGASGVDPLPAYRIYYCTGQYFPTEYRRAVCAVLASALWEYTREKCMPPVYGHRVESWSQLGKGRAYGHVRASRVDAEKELVEKGGSEYGHVNEVYKLPGRGTYASGGDWLRAHFRKEFGRAIAARWFS